MKTALKLLKNPTSLIGILLLLAYAGVALFAPLIAPVPKNSRDAYMIPRDGFKNTPALPSEKHILGTTEGQYDIFYGIVWGTRIALFVGVFITAVTVVIGLLVGVLSAFYGGWLDDVEMSPCAIRLASRDDAGSINDIQNHYVVHSTATFLTEPLTLAQKTD